MSTWSKLGAFVSRVSSNAFSGVLEAVRTVFEGDPETRRQVAFSVAMIALSAKMAKADGVVTAEEVQAFQEIFHVPEADWRNVARLYDLAKQDVAGYESYATRLAAACGSGEANCPVMEDILDGLFHIAKADGVLHPSEMEFLERVAIIFDIDADRFDSIAARHVDLGQADPYVILGVKRGDDMATIRQRYRTLVAENHPDKFIARGLPEEFIVIANERVAAINVAYGMIAKEHAPA